MPSVITRRTVGAFALSLVLVASSTSGATPATDDPVPDDVAPDAPIGLAECDEGSAPETGVQGQVPREDRISKRSRDPYTCNLEKLGDLQGSGAGILSAKYENCVFFGSFGPSLLTGRPGVQVIDVSDPESPRHVRTLRSPAMAAGTWETLKVNEERGLLAAVGTTALIGALKFDVYDISSDCTDPQLTNGIAGSDTISAPVDVLGHEGNWSPDGRTYYATSTGGGWLTAIDVEDPAKPRKIWSGSTGFGNHGLSVSDDGNTLYGVTLFPGGVQIFDVSSIQDRHGHPRPQEIGSLSWDDGELTQHTIPITQDGREYLVVVDEAGGGSARILDIEDPTSPELVRNIRLEINRPEHHDKRRADTGGDGLWGYEAHYCNVDRRDEPTALGCGFVQSGIRVFDIADVRKPQEIAYYNPGGIGGGPENLLRLANSPHALVVLAPPLISFRDLSLSNLIGTVQPDMNTDWCMSPPFFVGDDQLWFTCSDNGLITTRFTDGAGRT
ncbi:LVIVD repeat-containing protein [Aeromicrobium sp. CTD01-1L150]|uniref:LVIVD repeat-containing protein n=1 Tax=Aeromicrobium sp. CTD01-1L150 TaxID=3341830 RepID=UPI0035C08D68